VRQGFLELARSPHHCVLDAAQSPEQVLDAALREVRGLLAARVS